MKSAQLDYKPLRSISHISRKMCGEEKNDTSRTVVIGEIVNRDFLCLHN